MMIEGEDAMKLYKEQKLIMNRVNDDIFKRSEVHYLFSPAQLTDLLKE